MPAQIQSDVVVSRYASPEMAELFSQEKRIRLWRELWIALAEAERELGLPITKGQIDELRKFKDKINWDVAAKIESEIRHDVMAHVHAYAAQCKKAAGIIHLGATSTFVTDNADLIMMRDGLRILQGKLASVIDRLADFADREQETVTVAFTHFQSAQPTTVGKRTCLWIQDFIMDLQRLDFELSELCFHGVKGATGTQDSFFKLFDGNADKAMELDRRVTKKMGFERSYPVVGQTYPRKTDTKILAVLAGICESASKFGNDIRLLQALHQVEEPRRESQVGSSAMPYKENPMLCERMVGLSRYVIHLLANGFSTASHQWFERTLDDSSNRRIVLPHAFLVCDGVLNLAINVASGMKVRHAVIKQHLDQELPFLQTEEVMMAAVRAGADRQVIHEKIRKHAQEVVKNVREKGLANDLLARLRKDPAFKKIPPKLIVKTEPSRLVGLAPLQVQTFLKDEVEPIRQKFRKSLRARPEIRV